LPVIIKPLSGVSKYFWYSYINNWLLLVSNSKERMRLREVSKIIKSNLLTEDSVLEIPTTIWLLILLMLIFPIEEEGREI